MPSDNITARLCAVFYLNLFTVLCSLRIYFYFLSALLNEESFIRFSQNIPLCNMYMAVCRLKSKLDAWYRPNLSGHH